MNGIDIDITVTLLRFVAAALAAVALLCWARVGPGWLAGGLCAILGGLAVKLNGGTLTRIDTYVETWFAGHRSRALKADAGVIYGYLGEPLHVAAVVVFCATLLALVARSAMRGVVVTGAVGVGFVIEESIKAAVYPHGFPSGHVTGAVAFFGMSAVCLGIGRSHVTKAALSLLVAAVVLPIAFLALYSGAHTLTDVIGGMILGTALVAVGAAILTKSAPRVRLSRAAEVATAVSAHTTPLRTEDILFGRGY
jgi:undecaprenyl-diphosphatase